MSQQSQSQNESREQHYRRLERIQRQQTRRYILLPFLFFVLVMGLTVGIVLSLRTPAQVAVISDFALTIFVLCPLVICMFPVVILMALLVILMNKAHHGTQSPLRRLEQWTYTMEKRVEGWAGVVDSRVLNWAVKFAPIDRILSIFEAPSSVDKRDEGDNHGKTGSNK